MREPVPFLRGHITFGAVSARHRDNTVFMSGASFLN